MALVTMMEAKRRKMEVSDRWGPLLFGGDPYPHLFLCVCCWGEGGGVERYWCQKNSIWSIAGAKKDLSSSI